MTVTDEQRRDIDEFKVAVSLIQTGTDGFPLPGQSLELHVLGLCVLKVDTIWLREGVRLDDLNPEARSLLNLTEAASRVIAAMDSGDRDPAIPEAWFKARAELVEPRNGQAVTDRTSFAHLIEQNAHTRSIRRSPSTPGKTVSNCALIRRGDWSHGDHPEPADHPYCTRITAGQRPPATGGVQSLPDGHQTTPFSVLCAATSLGNVAFFAQNLVCAGHPANLSNNKPTREGHAVHAE